MNNIKREMMKCLASSLENVEYYKIKEYSQENLTDGEKKDKIYMEIQKCILEDLIEGYRFMQEINLELSEIGLQSDYKDLKKYEKRIMGSGV